MSSKNVAADCLPPRQIGAAAADPAQGEEYEDPGGEVSPAAETERAMI